MQKVVLITGASRGIGAQIAQKVCDQGGRVWLLARNQEQLQKLSDDLNQNTQGFAQWSSIDLSNLDDVKNWLHQNQEQLSQVTSIIHNAGLDDFRPFESHSLTLLELQINLNLTTPLLINRACIQDLSQKSNPSVIHMSSLAGYFPVPFGAPYSASKSALWQMNEALAVEYSHMSIRWVSLHPGFINGVGMHERHKEQAGPAPLILGGTSDQKVVKRAVKSILKGEGSYIINVSPVRPFLVLTLLFPRFYRWISRRFVYPYLSKVASAQIKEEEQK